MLLAHLRREDADDHSQLEKAAHEAAVACGRNFSEVLRHHHLHYMREGCEKVQ